MNNSSICVTVGLGQGDLPETLYRQMMYTDVMRCMSVSECSLAKQTAGDIQLNDSTPLKTNMVKVIVVFVCFTIAQVPLEALHGVMWMLTMSNAKLVE